MKIYLHPPREENWRVFSFSYEGKLRRLSDYQKEGGTRDSLKSSLHKRFYFKTADTDEVKKFIGQTKGLLGQNKHFDNSDYTTHMVLAIFLEVQKREAGLSIADFLSEIREEKVRILFGLPLMEVVSIENLLTYAIEPSNFGGFEMGRQVLAEMEMVFPDVNELDEEKRPFVAIGCPETTIRTLPLNKYLPHDPLSAYYTKAGNEVEKKVLNELRATQAIACATVGDAILADKLVVNPGLIRCYRFSSSGNNFVFAQQGASGSGLPIDSSFCELPEIFNSLNLYAYPLTKTSEFTPIDQPFFVFLSLMYKGFSFYRTGKLSDAFFQYIMALDLLLGGDSDNNKNIQARCSVIRMYCGVEPFSFEEAKSTMRQLYDARSRYAHQAKDPSTKDLEEARRVCMAVAKVLFSFRLTLLREKEKSTGRDLLMKWCKNLDVLAATHEAHQIPNLSQLETAYLLTSA